MKKKHLTEGQRYEIFDLLQSGKELDRTNGLDWYDYGARSYDTDTPAHGEGHSLGLLHSKSGLMTPSSNDPKRTREINQKQIDEMIDKAKYGKTYDVEGVGHYHNSNSY